MLQNMYFSNILIINIFYYILYYKLSFLLNLFFIVQSKIYYKYKCYRIWDKINNFR